MPERAKSLLRWQSTPQLPRSGSAWQLKVTACFAFAGMKNSQPSLFTLHRLSSFMDNAEYNAGDVLVHRCGFIFGPACGWIMTLKETVRENVSLGLIDRGLPLLLLPQ